MPIRINCRHCGKRFSAWDDLIGKPVKCPKCQQTMIVPSGEDIPVDTSTPAQAPAPVAPRQRTPAESPQPASPPLPNAASPQAASAASMPAAQRTPQLPQNEDFDENDELPYACPSCQQAMSPHEDLCDNCGYHRVLKRRIDISSGVHKPDKSTGFERMFRGQLHDSGDAEGTLRYVKIVGAIVVIALIFVCPPVGLLLAAGLVIGFVIHQKKLAKQSSDGADSAVNQDALSSFVWSLFLNCQRAIGWRELKWPFPTTRALTLHDPTFTDDDLASLENLRTIRRSTCKEHRSRIRDCNGWKVFRNCDFWWSAARMSRPVECNECSKRFPRSAFGRDSRCLPPAGSMWLLLHGLLNLDEAVNLHAGHFLT